MKDGFTRKELRELEKVLISKIADPTIQHGISLLFTSIRKERNIVDALLESLPKCIKCGEDAKLTRIDPEKGNVYACFWCSEKLEGDWERVSWDEARMHARLASHTWMSKKEKLQELKKTIERHVDDPSFLDKICDALDEDDEESIEQATRKLHS